MDPAGTEYSYTSQTISAGRVSYYFTYLLEKMDLKLVSVC